MKVLIERLKMNGSRISSYVQNMKGHLGMFDPSNVRIGRSSGRDTVSGMCFYIKYN